MGDKKIKRVFVNNVDQYSSKYIAKYLATCVRESDTDADEIVLSQGGEPSFHVVGTVSPSFKPEKNSFLLEYYKSPTYDELLERFLQCDIVVYNISENVTQHLIEEATWAVTALHERLEGSTSRKTFILVSTVMTWALTRQQNPEEANVVLAEEEYRRRRPHPQFKNHNELEKLVLKLGRSKKSRLAGYVVTSGLQYGKGEHLLHYFFKVSWLMQFPQVPIFGPGTNYIPMIHINDLGGVIQNIIEVKPKSKYILAVDDSRSTLEEVVKAISRIVGPGKTTIVPEEDAISMKAFEKLELEYLKIDLRVEAFVVKDSLNVHWVSEGGIVLNIERIVEEYKVTRQLLPIKLCLVGPPAVGKTTVTEKLCSYYQIHHIKIQEVIDEKIAHLQHIVNEGELESAGEEAIASAQKLLTDIQTSMEINKGRVSENILFEILQGKLTSQPCLNQGYVLDGFPKTYAQAKLFFYDASEENLDPLSKTPYNRKTIPEHIFALNATDEFLIKRVQDLPESEAEEKHYTHEEFVRRLKRYRQRNAAEENMLHYFDELEIYPEALEVDTDDLEYKDVMKNIIETVRGPKNYGLSPEEQEEEDKRKEEEMKHKLAAEATEKKLRNEAALTEMAAQYHEWQRNLSELERQEDELLEARSLPLRNYLMKYVMPSLSEAMVECCKIKPDNPVDFLAEYLLRNNQND